MSFSKYWSITNEIYSFLGKLNNTYNSIVVKINQSKLQMSKFKHKMSIEFLFRLENSIIEFEKIENEFKAKKTAWQRLLPGIESNILTILDNSYRICESINITSISSIILDDLNKSLVYYLNNNSKLLTQVEEYVKSNDANEYNLQCESAESIDITMNINALCYIIRTPLSINVSQDFSVNLYTNNEKVVKKISVNTSVSVYGSAEVTTHNLILKNKFDGDFNLNFNYEVGYSLEKLIFLYIGTISYIITKSFYVTESHLRLINYWKCRRRWFTKSCWHHVKRYRWSDTNTLQSGEVINKTISDSFSDKFINYLN